jgi:hypothetical protein
VQSYLGRHRALWAVFTAEAEVDQGEFLASYLQAVAFETECEIWRDVRLCRFLSPHFVDYTVSHRTPAIFDGELRLNGADSAIVAGAAPSDRSAVLVRLQWEALAAPSRDYKFSLRLLDNAGSVVSQIDDFPIGPLLPPTVWQTGEQKPGFMALPVPLALPPGDYTVMLVLYDSVTLAPIAPAVPGSAEAPFALRLAQLQMGEHLMLASTR